MYLHPVMTFFSLFVSYTNILHKKLNTLIDILKQKEEMKKLNDTLKNVKEVIRAKNNDNEQFDQTKT